MLAVETKLKNGTQEQFTSQDSSVCGTRVQKTLSTRTHNAAINILKKGWQYLGNHLNGNVGQTGTDPNACGESGLWTMNGDIDSLSRLIEVGISSSDTEKIPRHSEA